MTTQHSALRSRYLSATSGIVYPDLNAIVLSKSVEMSHDCDLAPWDGYVGI